MSNTNTARRTQAERRTESRQAVLDSACRLFGQKGYTKTSLEDIAVDCGLTIRPIYHYFGNKKALFAAVNDIMEQRIIQSIDLEGGQTLSNWRAYLNLCDDPGFRQIVLIDSPVILGRERWASSPVTVKAKSALSRPGRGGQAKRYRAELLNAVIMGAFTEAALTIADAQDIPMAKREAERIMTLLFSDLPA